MGLLEIIVVIIAAGLIWVIMFVGKAGERFDKLLESGELVSADITNKVMGKSMVRKSIFHYPDVNNGLHIIEYEFKDPNGNIQANASYVSKELYETLEAGDSIDIKADNDNWADNKAGHSLQRDVIACRGIRNVMIFLLVVVIGVYVYITL